MVVPSLARLGSEDDPARVGSIYVTKRLAGEPRQGRPVNIFPKGGAAGQPETSEISAPNNPAGLTNPISSGIIGSKLSYDNSSGYVSKQPANAVNIGYSGLGNSDHGDFSYNPGLRAG